MRKLELLAWSCALIIALSDSFPAEAGTPFLSQRIAQADLLSPNKVESTNPFDPPPPLNLPSAHVTASPTKKTSRQYYWKMMDDITLTNRSDLSANELRTAIMKFESEVNDNTHGLTDRDRSDIQSMIQVLQQRLTLMERQQEAANAASVAPVLVPTPAPTPAVASNTKDPLEPVFVVSNCAAARAAAVSLHRSFEIAVSTEAAVRNFSTPELALDNTPLCDAFQSQETYWQQVLDVVHSCPISSDVHRFAENAAYYVIQNRAKAQDVKCLPNR